jgi:hypothetical protein
LTLLAVAPPGDQTFANQKAAGEILEHWAKYPDHPGPAALSSTAYDYPAIADKGLPAARKYAKIAPYVPHALQRLRAPADGPVEESQGVRRPASKTGSLSVPAA